MLRAPTIAALALALAGCKSEPTFDERYDAAEEKILQKAQDLDAQLESDRRKTEDTESVGRPGEPQ